MHTAERRLADTNALIRRMLQHVALNGEAQYLITGDRDLLVLSASFQQSHALHILSPADYLAPG